MLDRFSHMMIFAKDVARAVRWYRDHLEYEVDYHAEGEYASLHHPRLGRLAIHGGGTDQDCGHGPMPYFQVRDLTVAIAAFRAKGIRISDPHQETESPRFTHFWDSEGNVLGIEEI